MALKNKALGKNTLKLACGLAVAFSLASPASAETTRERVLSEKTIVIGVHNKAPWGYRDQNGNPAGFHPDLVRAIFEPLGVTKVELVIADFGALIPGLVASRFDAIASGLYITPKRCELVAFSNPDLRLADAALVAAGNPKGIKSYSDIAANEDLKFGATRGSVQGKNAAAAGIPESQMLLFQNTESTIAALTSGRVDAIAFSAATASKVVSDPNIDGIERASPFTGLILGNGKEKVGHSAVAFRQNDEDLRDLYNERLAELRADGTFDLIMEKNGFSKMEKAPDISFSQLCSGEL
ncbi:ectoine/hydroxyectoine ABC transporter substrate-binding protein EhuB [Pelagibius litoralis]|uniref:Ectoine/hydroxyectoine ABC transporter substrate-binding protein EhuB n=1 Tax=Pelagibius litoralis TaxID=374515 RepID=A0A967EUX6_9PROT|nr:ectoine/hydroxyectoine ABC transporter substrate-binding protein EhuB [Pelagibius litoralis]NIA67866.1 ectoine/hydroxyectoine ABC transporter substrate-binding protein EhuB [Pelagibius litoralis]